MTTTLTPRQLQAVRLLCEGKQHKHIAAEMGCSMSWVGQLFDHAYLRTGARGRVALVLWAVRKGIVKV